MIQLSELISHDTLDVTTAGSGGKVTGIGLAAAAIVDIEVVS